jgi:hypothetical protein
MSQPPEPGQPEFEDTGFGDLDTPVDLLTPDLEELEQESPAQPAPEVDPLEALLAESLKSRDDKLAAKAARDRIKRGGLNSTEKIETEALIREWELRHEWEVVANVALFERQECHCGVNRTVFVTLLSRQVHRHMKDKPQRWTRTDKALTALPNEVKVRVKAVEICDVCAEGKGWNLQQATEWRD